MPKNKPSWEIEYKEEEILFAPDYDQELFDGTLYQRPRDIGGRFAYAGPLALIPVPPRHPLKQRLIKTQHRKAFRKVYAKYKFNLFPYKEAAKVLKINQITLALLWAHGYLERRGAGEYNLSGRPYGVHYRIIKWPL